MMVLRKSAFFAVVVRQGGVIHYLEQNIKDVGMCLFNFVKQDYGIRGFVHRVC